MKTSSSNRPLSISDRLFLVGVGTAILLLAQMDQPVMAQQHDAAGVARAYRQQHEHEIVSEFINLLSIPNVASDAPNIRRNARLISEMLEKRGVKTRLLEIPDAPPVVFGEPSLTCFIQGARDND